MKGKDQSLFEIDKIKEYKFFKNGFLKGGVIALVIFLLCLIKNSLIIAFYISLFIWFMYIVIFSLLIYKTEYYDKRIIIKRLLKERYRFLKEQGFEITKDLILEGTYKEFSIRLIPRITYKKRKIDIGQYPKEIEYEIILAFYTSDDIEILPKKESYMSGYYHIGQLYFSNHCVYFIPKNFESPDFKDILDDVINILKREELKPFDPPEEENT